tara:strand:- start:723 stop:1124 length:402 start_codon:yes stop_codon:yes gene_type:complete
MTNFSPRGIFENCGNLSQQVTMGVTRGMSKMASLGYLSASFTADAQSDVDFLAYNPITGDVKKIQVKTTTYKRKGNYIAALKSGGKGKGNRKVAKDFDWLYVLDADNNEYIIDYDKIKNRTTQITLSEDDKIN